eukprot:m.1310567 g.1310567  ORF g.1310567 m.1310567 type:complete len:1039 (-) comp24826_c0_seq6:1551-4667(-)
MATVEFPSRSTIEIDGVSMRSPVQPREPGAAMLDGESMHEVPTVKLYPPPQKCCSAICGSTMMQIFSDENPIKDASKHQIPIQSPVRSAWMYSTAGASTETAETAPGHPENNEHGLTVKQMLLNTKPASEPAGAQLEVTTFVPFSRTVSAEFKQLSKDASCDSRLVGQDFDMHIKRGVAQHCVAPRMGPHDKLSLMKLSDTRKWPLIRIGEVFKIKFKLASDNGGLSSISDTLPPSSQAGFRFRTLSSSIVSIENYYWCPMTKSTLCLRCGKNVVSELDPNIKRTLQKTNPMETSQTASQSDDVPSGTIDGVPGTVSGYNTSDPADYEEVVCRCNYDNDLLIGARVNGVSPSTNVSSCIRVDTETDNQSGTKTTFCSVYLRVPRERENQRPNTWMKNLPLPKFWGYYEGRYVKNSKGISKGSTARTKSNSENSAECRGTSNVVRSLKAMVIRVTERFTRRDGTAGVHVHQGFVRLAAKNGCVGLKQNQGKSFATKFFAKLDDMKPKNSTSSSVSTNGVGLQNPPVPANMGEPSRGHRPSYTTVPPLYQSSSAMHQLPPTQAAAPMVQSSPYTYSPPLVQPTATGGMPTSQASAFNPQYFHTVAGNHTAAGPGSGGVQPPNMPSAPFNPSYASSCGGSYLPHPMYAHQPWYGHGPYGAVMSHGFNRGGDNGATLHATNASQASVLQYHAMGAASSKPPTSPSNMALYQPHMHAYGAADYARQFGYNPAAFFAANILQQPSASQPDSTRTARSGNKHNPYFLNRRKSKKRKENAIKADTRPAPKKPSPPETGAECSVSKSSSNTNERRTLVDYVATLAVNDRAQQNHGCVDKALSMNDDVCTGKTSKASCDTEKAGDVGQRENESAKATVLEEEPTTGETDTKPSIDTVPSAIPRKRPSKRRHIGSKKKKKSSRTCTLPLRQEITITLDDAVTLSPITTGVDCVYGDIDENAGFSRSGRKLRTSARVAETMRSVAIEDAVARAQLRLQRSRARKRPSRRRHERDTAIPPPATAVETAQTQDLASTTVDDIVFYECEETIG